VSSSSTHDPLELPDQLGIKKSELEKRREKVAGAEALCLMHETFGGSSNQPTKARPQVRGGLTARQAAAQRYEQECKVTQEPKARYKQEKNLQKPAPKLVVPTAKERLASSARKSKKPTAEEDFETVADFKCQLKPRSPRGSRKESSRPVERDVWDGVDKSCLAFIPFSSYSGANFIERPTTTSNLLGLVHQEWHQDFNARSL
jgi:hypothetical protein